MTNRIFSKKCCIALAAMGIGLSTTAVMLRAEDMSMDDMQKTAAMQDKTVQSLKEHFDDATFVTVASMANTDEMKAADSALKMSSNDDVKMFAQHMIDDHTKVAGEMKELAEKKGFHVSDTCDAKHKMAIEGMNKLTGADFDKSYIMANVKDHEDTIALFKLAADNASDSDLKDWVKKAIPNFEEHLSMAKKLETKLMAVGS